MREREREGGRKREKERGKQHITELKSKALEIAILNNKVVDLDEYTVKTTLPGYKTNPMAYGTRGFNAAFTRALQ